jgi:hypothetical protein
VIYCRILFDLRRRIDTGMYTDTTNSMAAHVCAALRTLLFVDLFERLCLDQCMRKTIDRCQRSFVAQVLSLSPAQFPSWRTTPYLLFATAFWTYP